jgi:membrane protease YdiL (CAAX protease family)
MNSSPPLWLSLAGLAIAFTFSSIAIVGLGTWVYVIQRLRTGQWVLEHEPRRLAPWGFIDFVVAFIVLAVTAVVLMGVRHVLLPALTTTADRPDMYTMLVSSLATIAAAVATGIFIALRTRCSPRELGFNAAALLGDLKLGGLAFCALAIPTYSLQLVLVRFWPSKHPLIESLKSEPSLEFVLIAMFAAVVAAPLVEEFAFRVLLQGWLEKMFDANTLRSTNYFLRLLLGDQPRASHPEIVNVVDVRDQPAIDAWIVEPHDMQLGPPPPVMVNPYLSPVIKSSAVAMIDLTEGAAPNWVADTLPILGSASLFALAHLGHGPDLIPLFFLAAGMGYLYRRTNRIVPGLVVHFLLNLVSMLLLITAIYSGQPLE